MAAATETAIVLPPSEGFGPETVGAIGLLVHRLARAGAGGVVLGAPMRGERFAGVPFRAVEPGWGLSRTARYASGVAAALAEIRPRLVEVHNRPEVALRLARYQRSVSLILNNDPQRMRGAVSARQRGRLLRRLALVMTSSDWLRRRLLDGLAQPPAQEPVVLPNCVELPPHLTTRRESLILFAGRVVPDKGADHFVEACARVLPSLPGWRAEMIGADRFCADSPDTRFLQRLRPQAEAACVAVRGYVRNELVLETMQRAAIVVVPSRWEEPFGLVALEAMACGAALVCSPRGGLPEVAGQAALFADPDEPEQLAAAIFQLATDVGLRATLAAAGRLRAEGFAAPLAADRLRTLRRAILER